MPSRPTGHDRATATADRSAVPADLAGALSTLRLQGAIFLRGEYSEAWAYESLPASDAAAVLAPDARRVVLFHVVAEGRCWLEADGGERLWASAGDVIVLPYNAEHRMGGTTYAELVPIGTLIAPPPWETMPVIHHGQGGASTKLICGYLATDDALFDPRMRAFPPAFVVTPPDGPARAWVRASIDYALQQTSATDYDRIGAPTRIPELLLVEVLRLHLASAPASTGGWIRALHDPVVAPALAAIHSEPGHKWSIADLARESLVSPTVLDERFREVLGLAPIRYLTGWRMHVAEDLLHTTDLPLTVIARRVGYDSEEAFSRAFKRAHQEAPSVWRVHR